MTDGNSKRLTVWIDQETHTQLLEFLKDDSNRILGAKLKKGGAVNLGIQLLLKERQNKSLEQIFNECNHKCGGCNDD